MFLRIGTHVDLILNKLRTERMLRELKEEAPDQQNNDGQKQNERDTKDHEGEAPKREFCVCMGVAREAEVSHDIRSLSSFSASRVETT